MNNVTRNQWGAVPPRSVQLLSRGQIRGLAVHYSGMDADEQADHANCAARVRGIQRFHMHTRGWLDIAYSFVFCKHGSVYEGRGWGVRTAANGTNAGNDGYHAGCFLGDDSERRDDVTAAGRQALSALILEGQRRYPKALDVQPHSHFTGTECPGDELRAFVAERSWLAPEPDVIPRWWSPWARWRLGGRSWRRPGSAPKKIPLWAWKRLERFIREGKKP